MQAILLNYWPTSPPLILSRNFKLRFSRLEATLKMKINKGECPLKPTQLTPSKKKQVLIYYISLFILIGIAFSLILFYKHQQTLTITNGIVNMREGPGITYNMKEQLKEGTHYQVLDEQNHWKKIIANEGQVGWIPDWLTTDGVLSSNGNMQNSGFIATVINNQASVHEEAQASSKEIGKASQGEKFNIIHQEGGWINIQFRDDIGWLPQDKLEITPGTIAEAPRREQTQEEQEASKKFLSQYDAIVTATAAGAHICKAPEKGSEIVYKASKNEKFAYLGQKGAYYHVKVENGQEGYLANWLADSNSQAMAKKAEKAAAHSTLSHKTIVLDPGHGGKDPGATRGDYQEKDYTLQSAQAIKKALEEKGATVIMTRKDDTFIDLGPRAEIYNKAKADAFISLHYDAAEETTASGNTTYYYDKKSIPFAEAIQEQLMEQMNVPSNGIRHAVYQILADSHNPAILIELGYMSNPNDVDKFTKPQYHDKLADAIVNGLLVYFQN